MRFTSAGSLWHSGSFSCSQPRSCMYQITVLKLLLGLHVHVSSVCYLQNVYMYYMYITQMKISIHTSVLRLGLSVERALAMSSCSIMGFMVSTSCQAFRDSKLAERTPGCARDKETINQTIQSTQNANCIIHPLISELIQVQIGLL